MTVYYSENTKKRDFSLMIRPYSAIPPKHFWASQPQCSRSCKSRWQVPSLSHTEEGQKRWLSSCILLCPTCKMNCNFVTLGIPKECFYLSPVDNEESLLIWFQSGEEAKLPEKYDFYNWGIACLIFVISFLKIVPNISYCGRRCFVCVMQNRIYHLTTATMITVI